MNVKIKNLWVEALKSENYKQAFNKLKVKDPEDNVVKFCPLGVLCDICIDESNLRCGWKPRYQWDNETFFAFYVNNGYSTYDEFGFLPPDVKAWAELDSVVPKLKYKEEEKSINELNDIEKLSFEEIANLIEEQL